MKIQIPQTPIIQPDGKITLEWRIFFNELLRHTDISIATDAIDILEQSLDSTDNKVTGLEQSVSSIEGRVDVTEQGVQSNKDTALSIAQILSSLNSVASSIADIATNAERANIIDTVSIVSGEFWVHTNGSTLLSEVHSRTAHISASANESYTFFIREYYGQFYNARWVAFDSGKNVIAGDLILGSANTIKFSTPDNTAYIAVSSERRGQGVAKWRLEKATASSSDVKNSLDAIRDSINSLNP